MTRPSGCAVVRRCTGWPRGSRRTKSLPPEHWAGRGNRSGTPWGHPAVGPYEIRKGITMKEASVATEEYHPWTTYMWASEEARPTGGSESRHRSLGARPPPRADHRGPLGGKPATGGPCHGDPRPGGARGSWPRTRGRRAATPDARVPKKPTVRGLVHRLRTTPAAKRVLQEAGKPMRPGSASPRDKYSSGSSICNRLILQQCSWPPSG